MQAAGGKPNFKSGSGKAETPVKVAGGQITGVLSGDGKSIIYRGIPYAAPPVGDLRWRAPQPVIPWEEIKVCDTFSKVCPQQAFAYGIIKHFIPGIYDPESTCYGAFHTGECLYIFQTLDRSWRKPCFTDSDYELADRMAAYWANFAKTGDPNGETVPEWIPYTADNRNVHLLDI